VYYAGLSLGGFYGTLFHAVNPHVRTAALNVGGGSLVDTYRWSAVYHSFGIQVVGGHVPSLLNAGSNYDENYVLRDQPPPLQAPAALERVVTRCLEKSQGGRFQTVAELQAALRQTDREPEASRPSIAVLPFDNMSGDKDNEYFSDGLAEEIIAIWRRLRASR